MEKVLAIPRDGARVRREDGKVLAAGGEPVTRNSYWVRRQRDGDVTLAPIPPTDAEPTPAPTADRKALKAK